MDQTTIYIVIAVVAAVVALAVIAVLMTKRRSSAKLRDRFGPEYGRVVEDAGGRKAAEAELHQREKRVEQFKLHPLPDGARDQFLADWKRIQGEFVDDPKDAIVRADEFLQQVMSARGYPVTDFEQRAEDLSVEHPVVVENYRVAHDIAVRHVRGEANTEDLRQAMLHYRTLFDELAGAPVAESTHA
jgi:hypothetical protein